MVPVRQQPGINKSLSSWGAWPCNYIHYIWLICSSSSSSGSSGMFCNLQENATVRWTSFWFVVTPRQWHDGPSGVSNANIYPAGHWGLNKLICNCFYVFTASEAETPALTFVYAFPPLSSCRENRKKVMKPGIQLIQRHITEASNYRERWNYRPRAHWRFHSLAFSMRFSIKCVKILPAFYENSFIPVNVTCVLCNQVIWWKPFYMAGYELKPLGASQRSKHIYTLRLNFPNLVKTEVQSLYTGLKQWFVGTSYLPDRHPADRRIQNSGVGIGAHLGHKTEPLPPADTVLLDLLPVGRKTNSRSK